MTVTTAKLGAGDFDFSCPGFPDGCVRVVARRRYIREGNLIIPITDVRVESADPPEDDGSVPVPIVSVTVTLCPDKGDTPPLPGPCAEPTDSGPG